jgi:hypothetical protein
VSGAHGDPSSIVLEGGEIKVCWSKLWKGLNLRYGPGERDVRKA